MEERSELKSFAAESKMDYSFKQETAASSTTTKIIPIQVLSDNSCAEKEIQIQFESQSSSKAETAEQITDNIFYDKSCGRYQVGEKIEPGELWNQWVKLC